MPKKIVKIIQEVCKEQGISYTSRFDAKRLGELVIELRSISDEINCILERHEIDCQIRLSITDFLLEIGTVNHELIYLAKELKNDSK